LGAAPHSLQCRPSFGGLHRLFSQPTGLATGPEFRFFQGLFVLAVLANVAYCAAHLVDVVAQLSAFRMQWLKLRWILLLAGSAFAAVLANFFSQGIFAHAT
jgi:hypothetical protein